MVTNYATYSNPDKLEQESLDKEMGINTNNQIDWRTNGLDLSNQANANSFIANYNKISGSNLNTDSNALIKASNLANVKDIELPTPVVNNTNANLLSTIGYKASEQANQGLTDYKDQQTTDTTTPNQTGILAKIYELIGSSAKKGEDTIKLQEEKDIAGKETALNELNKNIASTKRAYEKQIRETERTSRALSGGVNIEIQRISKAGNEELADLAIQQAALTGDIATANKIIETTINAKYEPIESQLANYEKFISLAGNDMTESETFAAQSKLDSAKEDLATKRAQQTALINDASSAEDFAAAAEASRLDPSDPQFSAKLSSIYAKVKKSTGGAFGGLNTSQASMLNTIAQAYRKSPLVAASGRTGILSNSIEEARKDPKNAAKQLNLTYSYIQALDTYQSAVREGELSLVSSIDSKVGQLSNSIQQIQNGQIVRPEVIKQIADAAENIVKTISEGAKRAETDFASQANVVGLGDVWNQYIGGFEKNYNQEQKQEDLVTVTPEEDKLFNDTVGLGEDAGFFTNMLKGIGF